MSSARLQTPACQPLTSTSVVEQHHSRPVEQAECPHIARHAECMCDATVCAGLTHAELMLTMGMEDFGVLAAAVGSHDSNLNWVV